MPCGVANGGSSHCMQAFLSVSGSVGGGVAVGPGAATCARFEGQVSKIWIHEVLLY